ncbi:unnamed protein product [Polarella glacialis]|uniref:Uncharacterized protein n=1 Tax=Polarella glacialis TaxID=89957 RepID=A0A813D1E7_POLGL|nr:unnamed protein product [Polarella glacialis]CAE8587131.1 unnamed protein product [Polarella glacialis]CAE8608391.1 unnamed protein product [Polarella glacialis]
MSERHLPASFDQPGNPPISQDILKFISGLRQHPTGGRACKHEQQRVEQQRAEQHQSMETRTVCGAEQDGRTCSWLTLSMQGRLHNCTPEHPVRPTSSCWNQKPM